MPIDGTLGHAAGKTLTAVAATIRGADARRPVSAALRRSVVVPSAVVGIRRAPGASWSRAPDDTAGGGGSEWCA